MGNLSQGCAGAARPWPSLKGKGGFHLTDADIDHAGLDKVELTDVGQTLGDLLK
jgi:hypothetical protein